MAGTEKKSAAERLTELAALLASGMRPAQVAREWGVSRQHINNLKRQLREPPRKDELRIVTPQAIRVKAEMDKRGWTAAHLAQEAGIPSPGTVYEMLRGLTVTSLPTLTKLAHALELPLDALTGGMASPQARQLAATIPVRGGAHLGVWRSMSLRDEARGEIADVALPTGDPYAGLPRYGIPIDDDSMMGLDPPVPRGSVAIYADIVGADIAIESGRVYLVHEMRGDLMRSAFRRVQVSRDGTLYSLVPVTADAAMNTKETIMATREAIEAGEMVLIAGRFLADLRMRRD
jgi:transcriptional regulator with XRE-family HTH domain